jgi:hypothetical protein
MKFPRFPEFPEFPEIEWEKLKQEWEYRVESHLPLCSENAYQDCLNAIGTEGWEVAAVFLVKEKMWTVFKRFWSGLDACRVRRAFNRFVRSGGSL